MSSVCRCSPYIRLGDSVLTTEPSCRAAPHLSHVDLARAVFQLAVASSPCYTLLAALSLGPHSSPLFHLRVLPVAGHPKETQGEALIVKPKAAGLVPGGMFLS